MAQAKFQLATAKDFDGDDSCTWCDRPLSIGQGFVNVNARRNAWELHCSKCVAQLESDRQKYNAGA